MISVIVISHNYGSFLDKCLKSILKNDKKLIKEVIVLDDSSKDNTCDVVYKFKKKFKKIKYFKKNFKSLSKSINFSVKKATGSWITKVDADDYINQNFLKDFYNKIKLNKFNYIYGNIKIKNLNSKNNYILKQDHKLNSLLNYPLGSGCVYKKEIWLKVGGYNENIRYQDDYDFWLNLKKSKILKVGYVNKANYIYQKHSSNMSSSLIEKNLTKIYLLGKYFIA